MVGEPNAIAINRGRQNKNGQPDVVINLGRHVSSQGLLSNSDINRLDGTLHRLNQGVPFAITSGAGLAAQIDPRFAEALLGRAYLVKNGAAHKAIHAEPISRHTWENAIFTRRLIEGPLRWLGIQDLEINTSEWHKRALPIFEHAFGDDYKIRFNGVHDPASPQDLQSEITGIEVMNDIINNTPRGDLSAIEKYATWAISQQSGLLLQQAA
jgi:hypothetical protein